jgi:hypothetical protein
MGDFSVVLLRSDFALVSEKNYMKVHKNQWVDTSHTLLNTLANSQPEDNP